MTTTTSIDKHAFGLLGDFEGDDVLIQELGWCRQAYATAASAPKPPLARLVTLLGNLPLKGRTAVIRQFIAPSSYRDAILHDLMDYCFQVGGEPEDLDTAEAAISDTDMLSVSTDDEDDFVLIAYPRVATAKKDSVAPNTTGSAAPKPLNLTKFHIFQCVLVLMASSGRAGADASRRYLNETASTRYRAKILIQAATCFDEEQFSNNELYEHYSASAGKVKASLVHAILQKSRSLGITRQDFLRRVYEADPTRFPQLIYFLGSNYLATKMDTFMAPESEGGDKYFQWDHWGKHGDAVYLPYLRRVLEQKSHDQLALGELWEDIVRRTQPRSMLPRHVQALLQLLQDYEVFSVPSYYNAKVVKYLKERSTQGEDLSQYDCVSCIVMIPDAMLCKLTGKERLALAAQYLQSRDWGRFLVIKDFVSFHELPYESYFASLTFVPLQGKTSDPFWTELSSLRLPENAPVGPLRWKFLQCWADLHGRAQPSSLTALEIAKSQMTLEGHWQLWYASYTKFYNDSQYRDVVLDAFHYLTDECTYRPKFCPKFKTYAKFAKNALDMATSAYDIVSEHLPPELAVEPLSDLVCQISLAGLAKSETEATKIVSDTCIVILCDRVLPCLRKSLQFDPADSKTYVTYKKNCFLAVKLELIVDNWGLSEKVATAVAETVLDVYARATARPKEGSNSFFAVAVDPPPSNKCKFAFYDFGLHNDSKNLCLKIIKKLLVVVTEVSSFDGSLLKRLWLVVRDEASAGMKLKAFLFECAAYCPKHLVGDEKASIIERCTDHILSTFRKSPTYWKSELSSIAEGLAKLDLLEKVLDNDAMPPMVVKYLLVEHGGFVNEKARQVLKDGTFVADAGERAKGLTVWLTQACETGSCRLIAEAVSFAASRVKSESGIHRRTVFSWLESNFVSSVVRKSLDDNKSGEYKSHEILSSSILEMQKNDLSRLDCVGRHVCFPRLPRAIIDCVMDFDPSRLCSERRQLWIDCAIQMDWKCKAAGGDDKLACYAWPISLESQLPSSAWVSLESFTAAYPDSNPSSANKIARIGDRVVLGTFLRDFDKEKVFGPVQSVAMFETAIGKVWTKDLPSAALRPAGGFPEDEDVSRALLERLLVLYRLCGVAWEEVELLTTIFDRLISAIDGCLAADKDIVRAHQILEELSGIHGVNFALHPKLAQACDKFFRCAVAMEKEDIVRQWLPQWQTVYMESGRRVQSASVDPRLQHFLDMYAYGVEPDLWRPVLSKSEFVLTQCCLVRELLQMSPSALLLQEVRDVLFKRRQDILLQYVRDPQPLVGVFREKTEGPLALLSEANEQCNSVDELLFEFIDDESLLGCHSEVSVHYARYARSEASSSRLDLKSKIRAISKFMAAPSLQHGDVLAALQSDMDEAVRESLINNVFNLDSPWHILGYLLSQKAIEKNDQRITSSLLRYVAQHVDIDKVVRVVGLLLRKPRRKQLSCQLHRGAVRMLFDTKTPEALKILETEWMVDDLPDVVRSLIAQKCVECVASGNVEGWEATVLSHIARNPAFSDELKFCLFAPTLPSAPAMDIQKPEGVDKDEILDQFRQRIPAEVKVESHAAADKFRSLLEELENAPQSPTNERGTLRILAKLKKWSLSPNLFVCPPKEDPETLSEMVAWLTDMPKLIVANKTEHPDHVTQFGRIFCAHLFAGGVFNFLKHSIDGRDQEALLINFLEENDSAQKFRVCVRSLLDAALDLPARRHIWRGLILQCLALLMKFMKSTNLPPIVFEHLVVKPLGEQWKMLRTDAGYVQAVVDLES